MPSVWEGVEERPSLQGSKRMWTVGIIHLCGCTQWPRGQEAQQGTSSISYHTSSSRFLQPTRRIAPACPPKTVGPAKSFTWVVGLSAAVLLEADSVELPVLEPCPVEPPWFLDITIIEVNKYNVESRLCV